MSGTSSVAALWANTAVHDDFFSNQVRSKIYFLLFSLTSYLTFDYLNFGIWEVLFRDIGGADLRYGRCVNVFWEAGPNVM